LKYVLRHFVSGKVIKFNQNNKRKHCIKVSKNDYSEENLVNIEFAKLGDLSLQQNTYIYISYN